MALTRIVFAGPDKDTTVLESPPGWQADRQRGAFVSRRHGNDVRDAEAGGSSPLTPTISHALRATMHPRPWWSVFALPARPAPLALFPGVIAHPAVTATSRHALSIAAFSARCVVIALW